MRILIGMGGGLVVGVLFLIQFLGWCEWFPSGGFMAIHAPALILADLLVRGEAGWSVIPFALVAQWLGLGAIAGIVLQLSRGRKDSRR